MTITVRRVGVALLLCAACVGIGADLIASDLPLYCAYKGHRYVLPCLTAPDELLRLDQQSLVAEHAHVVHTPIPYGPLAQHPGGRQDVLASPSFAHWLGTDDRGRDVAARIVHGARVACVVGFLSTLVFVSFGALVGLACASAPWLDFVMGRIIDASLSIPALLLLLAMSRLSSQRSLAVLALAIAICEWPVAARLVRAEALSVRALPHVIAARGAGASSWRIAFVHVLPLSLTPVRALASFGIAQAVLFEAALGSLGFGVASPYASWGEILAEAARDPRPWLLYPPTFAIAILVLASRLADDTRDASR